MRKFAGALMIVSSGACFILRGRAGPPTSYWALPHYDAVSYASVAAHVTRLDYTITTVLFIDPRTFRIARTQQGLRVPALLPNLVRLNTAVPALDNRVDSRAIVRALASSSEALAHAASDVAAFATNENQSGIILELPGLGVRDNDALLAVLRAISDSAHAHSLSPIVVEVPAADTGAYPGQLLRTVADLLLVNLTDEHSPETGSGPLASRDWFVRNLGQRVAEFGANRVVAAVPLGGYFWRKGTAQVVSFLGAERLAQNAGTALTRDPVSGSLHAVLPDGEVWVMDHELVNALVAEARRVGVTRIALWGVGGEDPEIWNTLR